MPRVALLPLFASLASAAVVGDYDPMPTSPACDKFCGAWTCASRYGSFYCHELESFGCDNATALSAAFSAATSLAPRKKTTEAGAAGAVRQRRGARSK